MKSLWARLSHLWGGDPEPESHADTQPEDDPLQLRATQQEIQDTDARLRYLDYQVQILEGRVFNDHQSRRNG